MGKTHCQVNDSFKTMNQLEKGNVSNQVSAVTLVSPRAVFYTPPVSEDGGNAGGTSNSQVNFAGTLQEFMLCFFL